MFKRAKILVIGVLFLIAFFYGSAYGQESQAAPPAGAIENRPSEIVPPQVGLFVPAWGRNRIEPSSSGFPSSVTVPSSDCRPVARQHPDTINRPNPNTATLAT